MLVHVWTLCTVNAVLHRPNLAPVLEKMYKIYIFAASMSLCASPLLMLHQYDLLLFPTFSFKLMFEEFSCWYQST